MKANLDLSVANWRKSSYSNGGDATCVEFADNIPGAVPVRDSKSPHGPALLLPAQTWKTFIATLK
ncbi:DUF397 domain-containing protein [Streptomyces hesseae]|uniref:DUF397 domain-containing protein n=1 Tax=Streptomyces hesseae TaxID=3075519 RepID=A0ABU2SNP5_9ACTN|nr:DUF397 domain-containing protein [Streptomyces sp. DSM 40473]MDT0450598.1 DUF397 domain-containing protein [Streptomyces sp. DSM 40473]